MGPFVAADRGVLARVLAASGVERAPAPPESSYLGELGRAVRRTIVEALLAGAKRLHVAPWALWALVAVLAVVVALLILRAIFSRVRGRRRGTTGPESSAVAPEPASGRARDAAAWRSELERRLAAGRIPEALEALWWWLARSLAGGDAEADWTSRDLVARSHGRDLRDLVRRLDAFTYGPRQPGVEELRGLLGRLEEALA
ncbi:MAG TPA: hypothetical protein VGH73_07470 [Thermoanaerobaculia bacterium]